MSEEMEECTPSSTKDETPPSLKTMRTQYGSHNNWYIPNIAKSSKTGEKTIILNAVQWIRWCAQNPDITHLLWTSMKELSGGNRGEEDKDIDDMSIGEALCMYNWAAKMDSSVTPPKRSMFLEELEGEVRTIKKKVLRFFCKFWESNTGIRRILEHKVPLHLSDNSVEDGFTSIRTISLGKLLLSGKHFRELLDELECSSIERLVHRVYKKDTNGVRHVLYEPFIPCSESGVPPLEFAPILIREQIEKPEEFELRKKRKRVFRGIPKDSIHRTIVNRFVKRKIFRYSYEFPPDREHEPHVLETVLTLVVPWLVAECVQWPAIRSTVYPMILVNSAFRDVFVRHIQRVVCQKMLRSYPQIQKNFPDLWSSGNYEILADKEQWPGHWRTIGRILEMKGLCRGRSAVSLVTMPVEETYSLNRIRRGNHTGVTQLGTGRITRRWESILPASKALNLFEAYVRIKNEICFECGYLDLSTETKLTTTVEGKSQVHNNNGFVVQTDVLGGKVYIACSECIDRASLVREKRSCDSIPYCLVYDRMFILVPFAKMIYMDYIEEDAKPPNVSENLLFV